MKFNWNLFSIIIFAIMAKNFVEVHAEPHSIEIQFVKYNGGTLTRKIAVNGKPNEYTHLQFLNRGSGTAVFKTKYNGVDAAIKVLELKEEKDKNNKKLRERLKRLLKNEAFILEKLKVANKSAVELGYIELYDFVDEGILATKNTHENISFKQKLTNKISRVIRAESFKANDIKVMAMIVTYFDTDLLEFMLSEYDWVSKDANWMRSMTSKIIKALWNIHQKGIAHNDVAIQNVGLIGDEVVIFDFGMSVEYNASAKVKDMVYYFEGVPAGVKSNLSWQAIMDVETYLRRFVDDIISAILAMWSAHGDLPWNTEESTLRWRVAIAMWVPDQRARLIKRAQAFMSIERSIYHFQNYTNMAEYYEPDLPIIDNLLSTLYKKVIANATNLDYADLLKECSKPL